MIFTCKKGPDHSRKNIVMRSLLTPSLPTKEGSQKLESAKSTENCKQVICKRYYQVLVRLSTRVRSSCPETKTWICNWRVKLRNSASICKNAVPGLHFQIGISVPSKCRLIRLKKMLIDNRCSSLQKVNSVQICWLSMLINKGWPWIKSQLPIRIKDWSWSSLKITLTLKGSSDREWHQLNGGLSRKTLMRTTWLKFQTRYVIHGLSWAINDLTQWIPQASKLDISASSQIKVLARVRTPTWGKSASQAAQSQQTRSTTSTTSILIANQLN